MNSFRYKVFVLDHRLDRMLIPDYVLISVFSRCGNRERTRSLFLLLGVLQLVLLLGKLLFPPPDLSIRLTSQGNELTAIEHATPTSLYIVSSESHSEDDGMWQLTIQPPSAALIVAPRLKSIPIAACQLDPPFW